MAKLKSNQFVLPSNQLITERPILFQTDMVKAILDGRKTQTRRTKGLESKNEFPNNWHREGNPRKNIVRFYDSTKEPNPNPIEIQFGFKIKELRSWNDIVYHKSIYGKPGDLLWVRETWAAVGRTTMHYAYKANESNQNVKWKPSIHMPKSAARIWLMVEEVRVERLQDISEEDSIQEGIEPLYEHGTIVWKRYDGYYTVTSKPYCSFWSLWASINGEESWNANPWVWVVKFRVLSCSGKPDLQTIQKNYLEILSK